MNQLPLMHKTIQSTIKTTVNKNGKFGELPIPEQEDPAEVPANNWGGWRIMINLGFLFRVCLILFIFGPYLFSGWVITSVIVFFILYTFLMRH